ncbi:MAG: hypothetical protein RIS64_4011 [Bacteroidota bacterium]|jgi:hypothetical protein
MALMQPPAVEPLRGGAGGCCAVLLFSVVPEKESLLHSEIGFHNVSVEKQLSFTHLKNLCLKVLVNYQ